MNTASMSELFGLYRAEKRKAEVDAAIAALTSSVKYMREWEKLANCIGGDRRELESYRDYVAVRSEKFNAIDTIETLCVIGGLVHPAIRFGYGSSVVVYLGPEMGYYTFWR